MSNISREALPDKGQEPLLLLDEFHLAPDIFWNVCWLVSRYHLYDKSFQLSKNWELQACPHFIEAKA